MKRLIAAAALILAACGTVVEPLTPPPTAEVAQQAATPTAAPESAASQSTGGPCFLIAEADIEATYIPEEGAEVFGTLFSGDQVMVLAQTAEGWLGFDPGVAQAANTGFNRLRWVTEGDAARLEGGCDALPTVTAQDVRDDQAFDRGLTFCLVEMAELSTVYAQPDPAAERSTQLEVGQHVAYGRFEAWIGLALPGADPGAAGLERLWWAPADALTLGEGCDALIELSAADLDANRVVP